MSYAPSAADLCSKVIQKSVQMVGQPNNPETIGEATGLLSALMDDVNRRTVSIRSDNEGLRAIANASGHRKTVTINYYTPGNEDTAGEVYDICDAEEQQRLQFDFVADRYRKESFLINDETLRYMCEESSRMTANPLAPVPIIEEQSRILLSRLRGLRASINKDLNTLILANVGSFANGVAGPKSVDTIYNATKAAVPSRAVTVSRDLLEASISGSHFYVGLGKLHDGVLSSATGGETDQGFNFRMYQAMVNARYYADVQLPNVFANEDDFLVLGQGMAQCATWNRNRATFANDLNNPNAYIPDTNYATVISDPVLPNLLYDLDMAWDTCSKSWKVTIGANYGLFTLPPDAFAATDRLFGVNGVFHYRALGV